MFPERHGRLLAVVHVGDDHLLHRLEERIASGELVLHGDVDRAVLDERGELLRDVDDCRAFRSPPFGVDQSVPGADQLRALRQTVFRTLGDDVALGLSVERVARFEPLDLPEDGIASHRRVVHVNRDARLDELGDIRAIWPPGVEHAVLGLLDDERVRLLLEGRVGTRGNRGLHAGDVRCGRRRAAEYDERGAADRIVERDDRASVLLAPGGGFADAAGLGVPHLGDTSRLAERRLELRRRGVVERDKVPVGVGGAPVDPRGVRRRGREVGGDAKLGDGVGGVLRDHALRPHGVDEGLVGTAPRAVRGGRGATRPTIPPPQTRCAHGTRHAADLRAGGEQLADLLHARLAHRVGLGEDEERVRDAAGRDDTSVHDLQSHERLRGTVVVVIACGKPRVGSAERNGLAAPEEDVGRELAFLEHPLAARLVAEPVARERPPRLGAVEVHAPAAHRHAGNVLVAGPGLVGEAVVDDAVDAGGEHLVALRLDVVGRGEPASAGTGARGEGLRRGVAAAPHVGERRGEARVADAAGMVRAACGGGPVFSHRDVDVLSVLEVVGGAVAVGLDGAEEAVLVAELGEASGVVLREEVRDHAAEVLEEALGLLDAADDASGEHGEVARERVAHALLERLVEALGPVLHADLVAVDEDVVEAGLADLARLDAERLAEARHVLVEVVVHRRGGELVDLEAASLFGGGVVAASVADVADAEDRPVAGGDVPFERAVLLHLRREVDDGVLRDERVLRDGLRVALHAAA